MVIGAHCILKSFDFRGCKPPKDYLGGGYFMGWLFLGILLIALYVTGYYIREIFFAFRSRERQQIVYNLIKAAISLLVLTAMAICLAFC